MIFLCLVCRKCTNSDDPLACYLCGDCRKKVDALRINVVKPVMRPMGKRASLSVWILFQYSSFMRELLLSAKVRGDYHSLRCLCYLAESCSEVMFLVLWADVIMPAPSSLWGRLRGRYDVPGFWGLKLAKENKKIFVQCDSSLAYRFKKRALLVPAVKIRVREISPLIRRLLATSLVTRYKRYTQKKELRDAQNILVIDDIYTTGFTMRSIARRYPNKKIRFLAIAGSYGSNKDVQFQSKTCEEDAFANIMKELE